MAYFWRELVLSAPSTRSLTTAICEILLPFLINLYQSLISQVVPYRPETQPIQRCTALSPRASISPRPSTVPPRTQRHRQNLLCLHLFSENSLEPSPPAET